MSEQALKPLVVNEIFYSLQGEGGRAGCPSIFIRLADCDMACAFCDTNFTGGTPMAWNELLSACLKHEPCRWVVFTGGEPMLQLTRDWVLSPRFEGDLLPRENLDWCMKLVKENPEWRLSVQMHKAWGVR